jgi:hypothetical protein
MNNPYGIQQVDIPGVLGVYQSARQNRLAEMAAQRKEMREDAEFNRKAQTSSLLADIAKSMQPKGGGQSSQSAPPDTSANPQPGAAPAQPSFDDNMARLAELDFDAWSKVDSRIKEQAKQATSYMSQAVMDVANIQDEAERARRWAGYIQQAEASGMDIPTHLERYSPQALRQAAAEAGAMEKLIKSAEPDWMVVPYDATLVNQKDPQSIAQFGRQGTGGPQPGAVVGQYRFRGGNPNDRANWEPVGGAPSQGGGGFRP